MIALNYRSARPLCDQVADALRHLLSTGALQPGEALPSVGTLAASLAINPNTVQRAYALLTQEGYLARSADGGLFAASGGGVSDQRRDALLRQFDTSACELLFLGLTPEALARRLRQLPKSSPAAGKEAQA